MVVPSVQRKEHIYFINLDIWVSVKISNYFADKRHKNPCNIELHKEKAIRDEGFDIIQMKVN